MKSLSTFKVICHSGKNAWVKKFGDRTFRSNCHVGVLRWTGTSRHLTLHPSCVRNIEAGNKPLLPTHRTGSKESRKAKDGCPPPHRAFLASEIQKKASQCYVQLTCRRGGRIQKQKGTVRDIKKRHCEESVWFFSDFQRCFKMMPLWFERLNQLYKKSCLAIKR